MAQPLFSFCFVFKTLQCISYAVKQRTVVLAINGLVCIKLNHIKLAYKDGSFIKLNLILLLKAWLCFS